MAFLPETDILIDRDYEVRLVITGSVVGSMLQVIRI